MPQRMLPEIIAVDRMSSPRSVSQIRKEMAARERELMRVRDDDEARVGDRERARAKLDELRHWRGRLSNSTRYGGT